MTLSAYDANWAMFHRMVTRPVLAWLAAVVVATMCGVAILQWRSLMDPNQWVMIAGMTAFLGALGAVIAAIPSVLLIIAIRETSAPRPWADIAAVLIVMLASPLPLMPMIGGTQYLSSYLVLVPMLAAGAVPGALTYWFLAGCPRPPYRQRYK